MNKVVPQRDLKNMATLFTDEVKWEQNALEIAYKLVSSFMVLKALFSYRKNAVSCRK